MPDMSAIKNTPEISFIDNKTVEDVRGEMVADYEEYMTQAQGVTVSLDRASVHRMILYAAPAAEKLKGVTAAGPCTSGKRRAGLFFPRSLRRGNN